MSVKRPAFPWDGLTPMPNTWLRDGRTRFADKGMLGYLLSHAPGYELTIEQMSEQSGDGKDAITAILRRLETLVNAPIAIISTGADREETIVLRHPFEG